jgi:tRNA (cytidine/uridine-2'-O-)-methyltransferase
MFIHIVLYEPEIPPNTGNIMRLAANTGATLHLIEPLGFSLDNTRMRRAGLDYREWAQVRLHPSLEDCLAECTRTSGAPTEGAGTIWAFSTKAKRYYSDASFQPGDILLFGPETRGLPPEVLGSLDQDQLLRLPMQAESRSLNLANTVSIALYEAWRQMDFTGGQ